MAVEHNDFLERIPLPLFLTSLDGVYIYCNGAFAKFFNRSVAEIIGSHVSEFLTPNEFERVAAHNANLKDDNDTLEYELSVINGYGETRVLMINKTIVHTVINDTWILGTMTDVTDLKKLQNYQQTMLYLNTKLLRISQYIAHCENIQQLLDYMMLELKDAFGPHTCGCILVNDQGILRMASQFGYTHVAMDKFQIELDDSYFMRFAGGNIDRVLRINQIELIRDEDYSRTAETVQGQDMLSSLSSPIIIDERLFGLINFDAPKIDAFTPEQAEFMEYVRKQLAIAIKSMTLLEKTIQLSRNDQLTGLYNRHYFEEQVLTYIEACRLSGRSLHLIAVDADYLKRINDDMGHLAGDSLLVSIAEMLKHVCGPSALISRHGGDEFAAVVFDIDAPALVQAMEVGRNNLAQITYGPYAASFSYGMATLDRDLRTYMQLLKAADEAMYMEKRQRMSDRRKA